MRRNRIRLFVLSFLLLFGVVACGTTSEYNVKVTNNDPAHLCIHVNNYDYNGWSSSHRSSENGEIDASGNYCRTKIEIGNPR